MVTNRNTKQRDAIRASFESADRPLSPAEVLAAASVGGDPVGIATVYRTIRSLVEENWLVEVGLPGEPTRYERAGKSHHHHFRCRACDRVFEIPGCSDELRALTPKGFELEGHEIILYGRCVDCLPKGSGKRPSQRPAPHNHSHSH